MAELSYRDLEAVYAAARVAMGLRRDGTLKDFFQAMNELESQVERCQRKAEGTHG